MGTGTDNDCYEHARYVVRCAAELTRPRASVKRRALAAIRRRLRTERVLSGQRPRLGTDREVAAAIERARRGDEPAAAALYEHYAPNIRKRMLRATRDEHAADEWTNEALLRAFAGLHRWESPCVGTEVAFRAWLGTIARRVVSDHIVGWRTARSEMTDPDETVKLADATNLRFDRVAPPPLEPGWIADPDVEAAFQGLPRVRRGVMGLTVLGDLADREIADLLHTSEGGVRKARHDAVRQLRRTLDGDRPVPEPRRREPRLALAARPRLRRAAGGITVLPRGWARASWGTAARGF